MDYLKKQIEKELKGSKVTEFKGKIMTVIILTKFKNFRAQAKITDAYAEKLRKQYKDLDITVNFEIKET